MIAARLKDEPIFDEPEALRDEAFNLIREKSFARKQVTLSSGKTSDFYFDMKPTMLDPRGSHILAEMIFARLPKTKIDFIGGIELGAVPLIGPIVMLSGIKGRPIPGLIVRKKAKEYGSQRLIEGAPDLHRRNVVVVDDVTTSGDSIMKSIRALKDEGACVSLIICLLDREEGAAEVYRREGIEFAPLFKASEFLNS